VLDERRTVDGVGCEEERAIIDAGRTKAAVEIDGPLPAHGGSFRCGLAAFDGVEPGFAQCPGYRAAQTDDLGRLIRRRCAVTPRMHGIEGALDAGAVLTHEETQRQIDCYGV